MTDIKRGYTELAATEVYPRDLCQRIADGEIFAARAYLQRLDIYEDMLSTSIEGIRQVAGSAVADKVQQHGVENIHRFATLQEIAMITDKIYELAKAKATNWVAKIAPEILNSDRNYYFERKPNIRFVTPYDFMAEDIKKLREFSKKHGGGKITPHPPHRDSWVDCPDNVINVWIAVGPIPAGNGLTIFPESFGGQFDHVANGSIAYHENPGKPLNFDLDAGDAILFHGEHIHASVLNRIESTRHVMSFRIIDGKPHYPDLHYHHYLHSALANSPLRLFAELPANFSWGWVRTRLIWVAEKLKLRPLRSLPRNWKGQGIPGDGLSTFRLSSLPVNTVKAVTNKVCVARVGQDKVIAFDRRCPHDGGDFAVGSISDGHVVCPWHNLPFNADSGESPCQSLGGLRFYETKIEEDTVIVSLTKSSKSI